MARNRTIYNVLAVYASQVAPTGQQTGLNTVRQLSRVQTFNEDFTRNFTDVNQYGNLAALDRIEVEAPTVKASLSYYVTDGSNENYLGFTVANSGAAPTSCISCLLNKTSDEKNYYLLIADEGNDAAAYNAANTGVIGVGNGFMTSYSVNAAVGEIPTASVDLEALNIRVYSNVGGSPSGTQGPGINAVDGQTLTGVNFKLPQAVSGAAGQVAALQPGDITFSMTGALGFSNTDLKVQDFTLSFDLARTPLQKLGNRFAFSREINFPVTASLEVNANIGDLESGNLADLLCSNPSYNFDIILKKPNCQGTGAVGLMYQFKGAKLVSQSFSSTIGDNANMKASYEVQLGGPQDLARGIFMSGNY